MAVFMVCCSSHIAWDMQVALGVQKMFQCNQMWLGRIPRAWFIIDFSVVTIGLLPGWRQRDGISVIRGYIVLPTRRCRRSD